MGKHYVDWYIKFIQDAITERTEKIKKLELEKRLFEEEWRRIIEKENVYK